MKTTTKNTGIKVTTGVKAGGFSITPGNHNRSALRVKTALKVGSISRLNHNRGLLRVKTALKVGSICRLNHNRRFAMA
jgi:hypothetical protein